MEGGNISSKIRNEIRVLLSLFLFDTVSGIFARAITQEKEIQRY